MTVLPGAEPFAADGGPSASCSATASPAPRSPCGPWAEHLAAAGLTVRLPRLPGHGTRWQDMNDTRWSDWYGEVERAFDDLRGRCDTVFAMGLSMGGTLVLRLAEQRADRGRRARRWSTPRSAPSARTLKSRCPCCPVVPVAARASAATSEARRAASSPTTGCRCKALALAAQLWPVVAGRPRQDHRAGAALPQPGRPRRRAALRPAAAPGVPPPRGRGARSWRTVPRRDAGQRRPGDLRRQPRVRRLRGAPRPAASAGRPQALSDPVRQRRGTPGQRAATRPRSCRSSTSTRGSASTCWTCSARPGCRRTWSRPRTSSRTRGPSRCRARRPTGCGSTGTSAARPGRSSTPRRRSGPRPEPEPQARDDEPSHRPVRRRRGAGLAGDHRRLERRARRAPAGGTDPDLRPDTEPRPDSSAATTGTLPGTAGWPVRRCRSGRTGTATT